MRTHCPYAARAYDCVRPPSYKADLWRYCALYTFGGVYLDVEDMLLVPVAALVRPCDRLVLVNDLIPESGRFVLSKRPCKMAAVQISLMMAAPRHDFFRCALTMALRNILQGVTGRNTLDLTGPVAAGACLRKLHGHMNYSMDLFMAKSHERRSGGSHSAAGSVSIFRARRGGGVLGALDPNSTREAVRAHAWRPSKAKTMRIANLSAYVDYARAHEERSAILPNCSLHANGTAEGGSRSGRERFNQLWEAVARETVTTPLEYE